MSAAASPSCSMTKASAMLDAMGVARNSFRDRTALITGAARGIGEATARLLAARGARVGIVDMLDAGERVASEIRDAGGSAVFYRCDVGDSDQLEATLLAAEAELGPIDVLLNNAVQIYLAPLTETPVSEWDRVMAIGLRAPFVAMQRLLPGMVARRRGTVVNMISLEGTPFASALSTAKAGLRSLSLTAARELKRDAGVAVFSFLPGSVDTPGMRDGILPGAMRVFGLSEEKVLAMNAQNPGYPGLMPVGDCAAALLFLIAHAPEYHAQVADPFEPLARHGLIAPPADWRPPGAALAPEFMRAFSEVTQHNRELEHRIELRTQELAEAHARSEALLLNILPSPIAERLKRSAGTIADHFDEVTVLFADLVGFTPLTARMPPAQIVSLLDETFSAFDHIARRLGLEKIKTIGDCYMVVGGLPQPRADHAEAVAAAALEFQQALAQVGERTGVDLRCRMGMHVGPVVAGVIGKHKFIYDLWGDTVNTASRMESHGLPGRIHCTEAMQVRLQDRFSFEKRGEIEVKGKGSMNTFFLTEKRG